MGSFTPSKLSAVSYSTATDTTDSDFGAGLLKSSVTVVGSGDAAYVEISTRTIGDSYTKLLIHADGSGASFTDSSNGNKTITANGDATQSASQSKFGGKSAYFDGTGDYLSLADSDDFDFGVGDFTLDAWVHTTARGNYDRIVAGGTDANGANNQWFLGAWPGTQINFGYQNGSGYTETSAEVGTWNNGTWYHVAIVRQGANVYFFWNGSLVKTWAMGAGVAINTGAAGLTVGARYYNGPATEFFHGYIDELRISKGIARWTANFTPPDNPYSSFFHAGEFQSRVHDTTEAGTNWEKISWGESSSAGTDIKLKTRTGDTATPDGSWSAWQPSDGWYELNTGTDIVSPRARYIQYLSSFTTTVSTSTPQLLEVNIQFATNTATAPNLISPADDSWSETTTPVFDWDFVDEEADTQQGYEVKLSTDINFGVVNYSTGPYSSSISSLTWPSPIADGRYYWRVKTQDSYGKWSVWSSTYLVKIDVQPPTVAISSYSAVSPSQIKIYFTASDGESGLADTNPYLVEISQNPDMSAPSNSGWISQVEHTFSSLKRNGRYYFRVKAKDKADNIGSSTIIDWRTKPGAFQSKVSQGQPTRTGPNAFGFVGDASWEWDVPVKGGTLVTISAYIRYNTEYQGGTYDKPKLTLSGPGINESISATSSAENSWELRQLSGTPSSDGILTLKAEGFSVAPIARFYIDDIAVDQ